jgi:alanine racemase
MSLLTKRQYYNLNNIYISSSALISNYKYLCSLSPNSAICPVLKSNAYGHGITTTAKIFDSLGAPFLFVDSLYEAYELYKQKVKTKIFIMGYTDPRNLMFKKLPFSYAVYDIKTAQTLNQFQPGCAVHIFIDTGMNREGVSLESLPKFLNQLKKLQNIKIEGLMSHLATADDLSETNLFEHQISTYHQALGILHKNGINPEWRHLGASSGLFRIKDGTFNLFRTGKSIYGISPLADKLVRKLRPVLTFESTIALVKDIPKNSRVGYGASYVASREMKIAIVAAGYYDGLDRRLSNKGFVEVKSVLCPIVGRASMNMTTIDVSKVKNIKVGDKVTIFSPSPKMINSISNSAKVSETIPYDLLVHLASSIKRTII